MPPSIATDAKIAVHTSTDLYSHFSELSVNLHLAETEHTWQKIEQSLLHIQAITRGGAAKFSEFVPLLKENASPINNALLSERTKLSGTAGDLLNSIAPRLGEKFEPLVAVFVPTLLLICARTNKVAVKRAEKSLHFIVKHCRPTTILAYLKEAIKDKGQGLRAVAAGTLVLVLEVTEKEKLARRVTDVEGCVKSGATDSNSEVRKLAKRLFELYVEIWPERVEGFTKPMTPTIRRYLALPKTGGLIVDVPPPTAAAPGRATREPAPSHQPNRYEEATMASSHAQSSRSAPAYNFFPDLQKSTSSSSTSSRPAPGFSVNDATYAKRGLFADQITAARSARLARMPSFNFDDMAKSSSDNAAQPTMKRQPSFEQLRNHGPASSGAPTFRVPRFDVVVQSESGGSRDVHGYESTMRGDINAHTPSFASASGRSGKTALLAAYKQAFAGDVGGAKPSSSSSGERRHRDRSEKSSKHGDKRREKTVAVRFEPETENDNILRVEEKEKGNDHLHRSKSAPQIAVQDDTAKDGPAAEAAGIKPSRSDLAQSRQAARREAEWEDDEDERPTTPPERVLLAQTPRTGVKASRVPAQRVVMQSAVKVSAVRVAAPTPSAKIAASRVANESASLELSPEPKARVAPRTPKAQPAPAKVEGVEAAASKDSNQQVKEGQEKEVEAEQKEVKATKASKDEEAKPTETKKPATSVSTAQASKPQAKPVSVKSATAKAGPSASIAAKARLEARTATKPSVKPVAASASSSTAATDCKKVVAKPATTVSKPVIARKPLTASTAASRAAQKPAVSSTLSTRTAKPAAPAKPTTSSTASSAAVTRSKPAAATKSAPTAAPAKTAATKKVEATTLASVTSRLTAPTASTRNKIVPAAAVKKFQPKPSSSLASKTKPKSSIAASLTAKSKLVGGQSAASVKDKAVRRASAVMAARIEKHRRASAGGAAPSPAAAVSSPVETADPVISAAAIEGSAAEIVAEVPSAEDIQTGGVEKVAEEKKPEEQEEVARTLNQEEETNEAEAAEVVQAEGLIMDMDAASATNDESQVSEAQGETADSTDQVSTSHDVVEEEEPKSGHESTIAADETPIEVATTAKAPVAIDTATPVRVRTPLSAKDPNLPKATPVSNMTSDKASSPLLSSHKTRSPFASSPLRRSATPKASLLSQLETESSFEESESESDMEDESDEVVQLHFGARQSATKSPMVKNHQVVAAARKQLVLGLDSSSDASLVEANASDETVLLESSA